MDILLIAPLAIITFFLAKKLNEKFGIAYAISYIITGTIIGMIIRSNGIMSINEILPHIDGYTSFLLLLMFFSAGFSVNTTAIIKSGTIIPKLAFIPSFIETFVVGILMYFLIKYFGGPLNLDFNIFETILLASILALSSTANVVPYCIELIQGQYKSKNNIQNTMVAVSVTDGFSTLPIVILALYLAIEKYNGTKFTGSTVALIGIGVIVLLIGCGILGFVIGRLIDIVAKPIMKNLGEDPENEKKAMVISIAIFLLSYLFIVIFSKIPTIGAGISSLSVLIICVIGTGINHYDKTGASRIISRTGNKLFAFLGMPIVFLSVGTKLNPKMMLNPNMLIIGLVTCCVAVLVKGGVGVLLLDKEKYTKEERKFVFSCFVPKGLALVNFSVIFSSLAFKYNATMLINFMIMLAGITIIVTIPMGVTLLSKSTGEWFKK